MKPLGKANTSTGGDCTQAVKIAIEARRRSPGRRSTIRRSLNPTAPDADLSPDEPSSSPQFAPSMGFDRPIRKTHGNRSARPVIA